MREKISCDVLFYPNEKKYFEEERRFQGVPTIAATRGGRLFAGLYAGGFCEPHMDNYNVVVYSDDKGKTWSKPFIVIPSSIEKLIHAYDVQLWVDPDNRLHVYWVQDNAEIADEKYNTPENENKRFFLVDGSWADGVYAGGYIFKDTEHAQWEMVCENPDADEMKFSEPQFLFNGFIRSKPTVLEDGTWILCNYNQAKDTYHYSLSCDKGKTYEQYYGGKKLHAMFDEPMAYQCEDGTVKMYTRNSTGYIGVCVSYDKCSTWTDCEKTDIINPDTRFCIMKLPSGRTLLINNDHQNKRTNMTAYLSEDDGKTWKYKVLLDNRESISYPEFDMIGDTVYVVYDREREFAKEILLCKFTEENMISNDPILPAVISKGLGKGVNIYK